MEVKIIDYLTDTFLLSDLQRQQFEALPELYRHWNEQINVISRKDIDNLMERHVMHALAIAMVIDFPDGSRVMDIGTGGGFPGIPLAILFPQVQFHLVDSIGKKLKVVEAIAEEIGLSNVTTEHNRAEKVQKKFHYIVSRAVTNFTDFERWTRGKIEKGRMHPRFANGIFYLKGGDLRQELQPFKKRTKLYPISKYFNRPFFEEKYVVYYF
ncbi:MAG: 16S rRNA (guanine(527)-N(7))-methyltransferase RsmG [Cryomorphaceae bacterium]|nr:16S rRNA (guanine(527)-N(7))-methyltransferase RsmG [Cryomorphaceae bacterium]